MSQSGIINVNGTGGNPVLQITPDVGGAVTPVGGNINLNGAPGVVTSNNGPGSILITVSATVPGVIITTFNTSGVWNKNPSTKYVTIQFYGAGSGGGSGNSSDDASDRDGGGGGSGLGFIKWSGLATIFNTPENVTVGAGGLGGASVTGTTGNDGGGGGDSSVGTVGTLGFAYNQPSNSTLLGTFGMGGALGAADGGHFYGNISEYSYGFNEAVGPVNWAGSGFFGMQKDGVNIPNFNIGGFSPFTATQTTTLGDTNIGAGGGGGIDSGGVPENGGKGGDYLSMLDGTTVLLASGAGGTVGGGQNGGNGLNATSLPNGGQRSFGSSGGGGASSVTGAAGTGGNGGFPGGGGGGGGASLAANASGAGGNGGNAQIVIIEFL